jgi:transposase
LPENLWVIESFAGLCRTLTNGPTEGHINRLKFLKRQMYGRASVEQ